MIVVVVVCNGGQGGHSGQVDSCQVVFYTQFPELCYETSRIESFLILSTHRLFVDGNDAKILFLGQES